MLKLNSIQLAIFTIAASAYADVTVTSGLVSASYATSAPASAAMQLQGAGFTLSGTGLAGNAAVAVANSNGVTFNPTMSETLSGPPFAFGGNLMQLVLNGKTYTDQSGAFLVVELNFVGPLVTAPAGATAAVSNIPFTMTGSVTVHSGSATGPIVAATVITGSGLYSSSQQGSAAVSGRAAYQFQPASATAFGMETSTQGAWVGKYGADGYVIANGASSFPAYATVSFAGDDRYTWATETADARALWNGADATVGIASAYTQAPSTSFTININFNDGKAHRVALYVLDWDTYTRTQTVTITDAATKAVLDTEALSNFHEGHYLTWNLKGKRGHENYAGRRGNGGGERGVL